MNKPQDFDEVLAFTDKEQLPPGGYICRIMQVEETTSQRGADMIKISLEIAEGNYKDFFSKQYKANTAADKKWGCTVNQLVYDSNGNNTTNRGFKTFTSSVVDSNNGFLIQWGNNFAACFKNKLVGGLFRREQFIGNDGKEHFSTKCFMFRGIQTIRDGVKIPEDKLLDPNRQNSGYPPSAAIQNVRIDYSEPAPPASAPFLPDLSDFEEIISDSGLPF